MKVGTVLATSPIGVKGSKMHDGLVKKSGGNFLDSVIIDFVVIVIEEKIGLGFLSK